MAISKMKFNGKEPIKDEELYGKNIYIIGSSELGPTNEPTLINTIGQLYNTFGMAGNIITAFKQIKQCSNNNNVTVIKTTGLHSLLHLNVNINKGELVEDGFVISSMYSSHIYNNIKVTITNDDITFNFPKELGNGSITYFFKDYMILGLLERAINEDTKNGKNFVYAQCHVKSSTLTIGSLSSVNATERFMYGGDNGMIYSKDQLYFCLEETYSFIEGDNIDILIPLEAFMDDICPDVLIYGEDKYNSLFYQEDRDYLALKLTDGRPASYYEQLLMFCIKQLRFGLLTHGIMGYNLTFDTGLYDSVPIFVTDVIKASLVMNKTNKEIEPYWFLISVVAGDLLFYNNTVSNGYVAYASVIANIKVSTNSTNKIVCETVLLFNEFDNDILSTLSDLGVVSFRHSPLKNCVVINNGVTTATSDSDFRFLCNVRMIQLTLSLLKQIFESYIGESIDSLMAGNLFVDNLNSFLDYLISVSVIEQYTVDVTRDDILNQLNIDLTLKTLYMLESINTKGSIKY